MFGEATHINPHGHTKGSFSRVRREKKKKVIEKGKERLDVRTGGHKRKSAQRKREKGRAAEGEREKEKRKRNN